MLRWSGDFLAAKSGVSLSTIRRLEAISGVPDRLSVGTFRQIVTALEEAGIEFIGTPEDRPGVRLNKPPIAHD